MGGLRDFKNYHKASRFKIDSTGKKTNIWNIPYKEPRNIYI